MVRQMSDKEGIAGLSLRGAKVTVPSHTDGQMELLWQGRPLAFEKSVRLPVQEAPIVVEPATS